MKSYQLITLLSGAILLLSNVLLGLGVFDGHNVADGAFGNVLIGPAGYTFSIWGVIYLGLFAYSVYQCWPHEHEPRISKAAPYISINMLANAAWLPAAAYEIIWLTLVLIAIMLYTLVMINQIFVMRRIYVRWADRLLIKVTFSIYFAWVTIATALNVTVWLKSGLGWEGAPFSELTWGIIILFVAFFIVLLTFLKVANSYFAAVVIWAYMGIYMKTVDSIPQLAHVSGGLALVMVLFILRRFMQRRHRLIFS